MQYKTGGGAAGGAAEVRRSAQSANLAVSSKPNMQIDFFKSTILNLLLYELDLSKLSQIVIINSVMYDAHFFFFHSINTDVRTNKPHKSTFVFYSKTHVAENYTRTLLAWCMDNSPKRIRGNFAYSVTIFSRIFQTLWPRNLVIQLCHTTVPYNFPIMLIENAFHS